jgi:hypothetical protein
VKIDRLLLLFAAIAVNGCRCNPPTKILPPDFLAMPTALNFNACPTTDEMGKPVMDVFPDRQTVTITNDGTVSGELVMSLVNADAGFRIDPMTMPDSLNPSASVDVNVLFSPLKKGDAHGTLVIDDGDPTTMPVNVDLIGTGINLPAQPTVEAAIESYATPGDFSEVCKKDQPLSMCEQDFPDTLIGDSSTLRIKLRNTGCPSLKVTGIDVQMVAGGADDFAFFLDQPSTLPSAANPMVMSQADGTNEITLVVRFSPHADMSGNTQRFGQITITTNDPATPMMQLSLAGNGVAPSIYAVPTFCNMTDPMDPCAPTGAKVANQATFVITNGGSAPVTIQSANFVSSGNSMASKDGRFTVMTPIDGAQLMPAQTATLTVQHHDMPLFVIDQIEVVASPASAGKITLVVEGGTEPCLQTDPDMNLEFLDAGTTMTLPVKITALTMDPTTMRACGALIINSVEIAQNPFFTLDTMPMAGMQLAPGANTTFNVKYTKPVTGGRQAQDLVIKTNDPAYGDPSWKKILLESESPLNQVPVGVLKGCLGSCTGTCSSGNSMNVHLSTDFMGGNKDVILCAGDSYDPGNETMPNKGIAKWQFVLGNHAGSASVDSNGTMITMDHTTLHLDPVVVGQDKIFLYVADTTNQMSSPVSLTVNIYQ